MCLAEVCGGNVWGRVFVCVARWSEVLVCLDAVCCGGWVGGVR